MANPLTEKEVNQLLQLLTDEQRKYLENYMKQSKKSKWLENLAKKKGYVLQKDLSIEDAWNTLNDWELEDVLDGGYGLRPYKCECGMPLRFCYIVRHRAENKMYRLGETCLENYTMLSSDLIQDITKGFHKIDLERDDILIKYAQEWTYPTDYEGLVLPEPFQKQVHIGLPLSKAQMKKIERLFKHDLIRIRKEKKFEKIIQQRRKSDYIQTPSQQAKPAARNESITYDRLIQNHLEQLKQIMKHENNISNPEMKATWKNVQQMVLLLKQEEQEKQKEQEEQEHFDYSKFLVQLFDLLYHLKLY
ncbi:hypothetical protein [Paenibacillus eucommiae]|uniref:DUF3895 domain-containing protein n=1 Tax=Paenibacillus eucommiae TaxID=1355755 RepID=A0ABS4IW49_9BACL|nr:hypothetical protein [Paenibacillus eucommiae]MBP1991822.1 hypothetical protein [Paenibacillus eucommiae]